MTYEGIEYVIRAGLGRNEWAITIHFPNASDALARSSVVKVTGTRDEAIALTRERISQLAETAETKDARLYLILSFPKIIYARSDDAIWTRLVW